MTKGNAGLGLKIAVGSGTLVLFRAIDRLVGIVSVTILARILAPEAFGLIALATTLAGLVEIFADLGLEVGLIRDADADRSDYDTAWTLQVLIGVGVAVVMTLLAGPAAAYFRDARVEMVVYALAVSKTVASLSNIRIVDFRKQLEFDREFRLMVTVRLASFAATLVCALIWRSYWALVAGIFTRSAFTVMLSYIMVPYCPRLTLARFAKIMVFSRWLLVSGLIVGLNQRLTNVILGRLVSVENLAFYNLADEVSGLITTEVHAPVRRALYPGYAKIANDRTKLSNAYVEVFSLLALVSLPLVVGVALLGQQLVLLLLGSKWAATGPLLQILCVAGMFRCFNTGGGLLYLVMGRPHFATGMAFFKLCTLAPVLYFAARRFGATGAAWAVAAMAAVFLIVEVTVETRFLGVHVQRLVAVSWRTVAASGAMSAVLDLLRGLFIPDGGFIGITIGIMLVIAAGAVVYVGALLGLWVMSGRPQGPEIRLLGVASRIARTMRK